MKMNYGFFVSVMVFFFLKGMIFSMEGNQVLAEQEHVSDEHNQPVLTCMLEFDCCVKNGEACGATFNDDEEGRKEFYLHVNKGFLKYLEECESEKKSLPHGKQGTWEGECPWFECDHMFEALNLRSAFIRHMRNDHTEEKPFTCKSNECVYSAATIDNLQKHVKIKHATLDSSIAFEWYADYLMRGTRHESLMPVGDNTHLTDEKEVKNVQKVTDEEHKMLHDQVVRVPTVASTVSQKINKKDNKDEDNKQNIHPNDQPNTDYYLEFECEDETWQVAFEYFNDFPF